MNAIETDLGPGAGSVDMEQLMSEDKEKRRLLEDLDLFRKLRAEEFDRLVAFTRWTQPKSRTVLFRKNDPGTSMMVVRKGRIKVCAYSEDGQEQVLNTFGPGDVFGEVALLDGSPRTADAIAIDDCELLVLDRRDFIPFLLEHSDASVRMLEVLTARLRRVSKVAGRTKVHDQPLRAARNIIRIGRAISYHSNGGASHDSIQHVELDTIAEGEIGSDLQDDRLADLYKQNRDLAAKLKQRDEQLVRAIDTAVARELELIEDTQRLDGPVLAIDDDNFRSFMRRLNTNSKIFGSKFLNATNIPSNISYLAFAMSLTAAALLPIAHYYLSGNLLLSDQSIFLVGLAVALYKLGESLRVVRKRAP